MNINFEIVSTDEADHTVVARYWTDLLPKEQFNGRTDYNIGLPSDMVIDPTSQAFRDFILQFAPSQWFGVLEEKLQGQISPVTPLLGGVASFQQQVVQEAQLRLDSFFRQRGYDGVLSCATYATSTVPKFAAEGQYAVDARDATWSKLYQIMADVEAGTRTVPTLEVILAELPVLAWPA